MGNSKCPVCGRVFDEDTFSDICENSECRWPLGYCRALFLKGPFLDSPEVLNKKIEDCKTKLEQAKKDYEKKQQTKTVDGQFYKNTIDRSEQCIQEVDKEVERELAAVKEKLAELQRRKKSLRQIYDASCDFLGVENKLQKLERAGQSQKKDNPL